MRRSGTVDGNDDRTRHGASVLFDSIEAAYFTSEALRAEGVYAPPVVQIGVPRNAPRIRFFITAAHSFEEIDRVVDLLSSFSRAMEPSRIEPRLPRMASS